jgi:hypothetical protein
MLPITQSAFAETDGVGGRIAVLVEPEASLSPADTAVACEGLVGLSFLMDSATASDSVLWQVASGLAPTSLVDFSDEGACLAAVRRAGAGTVVTFAERLCPLAARLNRAIGAHPRNNVPWGRKDLHRATLRDAGLSRIRSVRLHAAEQLRSFAGTVGFPVVVKPVDGFASRNTWLLADQAGLDAFLSPNATGRHEDLEGLFAEEYIVGTDPALPWLADYLSVEVFRSGNPHAQGPDAFVTHRPPTAWPLRETGMVLPSPLPSGTQRSLITHARGVLDALQANQGAYHVEIKPAPHGPETIEVNGRIGGFVARAVRYGTGRDLGRLALSCLLGHEPDLDLRWTRCVLGLLFQPPAAARRVVKSPDRQDLAQLTGVLAVEDIAPEGTAVHWRNGTFGMVARLWLAADNYEDLREYLVRVTEFLTERFAYVDARGAAVHDLDWLEAISRTTERVA